MSQRHKVLILCLVMIGAGLVWIANLLIRLKPTEGIRWEQEVTVSDHVALGEKKIQELIIPKDGEGRFSLTWYAQDPGFITGILVRDPQGTPVFGVTGDIVDCESKNLQLSAGSYTLETYLITDEETYLWFGDMISVNKDKEKEGDRVNQRQDEFPAQIIREGTWKLEFSAAFLPAAGGSTSMQMTLSASLVGVSLGIFLITLSLKGRSSKRVYDERQELIRGRGYRLAFLTMAAYCGIMMILEISGVKVFMERAVELGLGALIGLCVHVVYCIWKDGYYAMNESIRRRIGVVTGLVAFNGLNVVFNIKRGGVLRDGELTFYSFSIFIFMFMVIMLVSLVLRYVVLVKEQKNEDEDEGCKDVLEERNRKEEGR